MLLPIRHKTPPDTFPFATLGLIAVNVLVFLVTTTGLGIREEVVKDWAVSSQHMSPHRFLASMFLHGDLFHLLGNLWFLWLFGSAVEGRLRAPRFLLLYLLAGVAGDLLQMVVHPGQFQIGASGAIMGCMGAALYMFPHSLVDFFWMWGYYSWGVSSWRMYWVAAYYMGYNLIFGLLGFGNVGYFAHIGGFLGGVVVCLLFIVKRDNVIASDAKALINNNSDYIILNERELSSIAESNSEDPKLALAWMIRSITSMGPINIECLKAFHSQFHEILKVAEHENIERLAIHGSMQEGLFSCAEALVLAGRLEQIYKFELAERMYLYVVNSKDKSDDEQATAIFRFGRLQELSLLNVESARLAYIDLLAKYPAHPLADQARMHLDEISKRKKPSSP